MSSRVGASRIRMPPGPHPVHDTQIELAAASQLPPARMLPGPRDASGEAARRARGAKIGAKWFGTLSGSALLSEASILAMAQPMTVAGVAELVNASRHHVRAMDSRDVDLALAEADLSAVTAPAIDETSSRCGHDSPTFAADTTGRKVVFVTEGEEAETIAGACARSSTASRSTSSLPGSSSGAPTSCAPKSSRRRRSPA